MILYCPELNQIFVLLVNINVYFDTTDTIHRWIAENFEMNDEKFLSYEFHVVGFL